MSISGYSRQNLARVLGSQTSAQSIVDAVDALEAGGASEVMGTKADSAAANGELYYSSDQSALAYKDGDGNANLVRTSLVATGVAATDAAAMQALFTAGGTITLDGAFKTDQTLTIPAGTNVIGTPGSSITFDAAVTPSSDYMLHVTGGTRTEPAIANIKLWCAQKGRGVLFDKCYYGATFENLQVDQSYEVSVDLVDCYGSWGHGLRMSYPFGIGLRLWRCNAARFSEIYGGIGYALNWPSAADTTVTDGTTAYVQTAAAKRSQIVIAGNSTQLLIDGLTLEGNNLSVTSPFPLVSVDAGNTQIRNVHLEGNDTTDAHIICVGDNSLQGTNLLIDNIRTIRVAETAPAVLLDLTGTTNNVEVRNAIALSGELSSSLVRLTSGTHNNVQVNHALVAGLIKIDNVGATRTLDTAKYQGDPAVVADGVSEPITAANLQARILTTASSTAGREPTVPTGTALNAIVDIGASIDWTFINTGNQVVTVTAAADHTLVGYMVLTAAGSVGSQGTFRTRVTAANTAITYRLS